MVLNVLKTVGDPKKKASSPKLGVKNKSKKETFIVQRG
jgi:hypothetical protein